MVAGRPKQKQHERIHTTPLTGHTKGEEMASDQNYRGMSVEEAERAMKEDRVRAFSVDAETGKVDGVKTFEDHWVLFKQQKPKEK